MKTDSSGRKACAAQPVLRESYRGIWINGIVPEPHLQTKRKANHAVTNDKKFGVQNNA